MQLDLLGCFFNHQILQGFLECHYFVKSFFESRFSHTTQKLRKMSNYKKAAHKTLFQNTFNNFSNISNSFFFFLQLDYQRKSS